MLPELGIFECWEFVNNFRVNDHSYDKYICMYLKPGEKDAQIRNENFSSGCSETNEHQTPGDIRVSDSSLSNESYFNEVTEEGFLE